MNSGTVHRVQTKRILREGRFVVHGRERGTLWDWESGGNVLFFLLSHLYHRSLTPEADFVVAVAAKYTSIHLKIQGRGILLSDQRNYGPNNVEESLLLFFFFYSPIVWSQRHTQWQKVQDFLGRGPEGGWSWGTRVAECQEQFTNRRELEKGTPGSCICTSGPTRDPYTMDLILNSTPDALRA